MLVIKILYLESGIFKLFNSSFFNIISDHCPFLYPTISKSFITFLSTSDFILTNKLVLDSIFSKLFNVCALVNPINKNIIDKLIIFLIIDNTPCLKCM